MTAKSLCASQKLVLRSNHQAHSPNSFEEQEKECHWTCSPTLKTTFHPWQATQTRWLRFSSQIMNTSFHDVTERLWHRLVFKLWTDWKGETTTTTTTTAKTTQQHHVPFHQNAKSSFDGIPVPYISAGSVSHTHTQLGWARSQTGFIIGVLCVGDSRQTQYECIAHNLSTRQLRSSLLSWPTAAIYIRKAGIELLKLEKKKKIIK